MIVEPELPIRPSQSSEHEPNVAPVPEQPDVSMTDPDSPETPGDSSDNAEKLMMVMTSRHQPSLSRTVSVHIGTGELSTKFLLQNLMILCRREDGLLQRDLRQLLKKNPKKRKRLEPVPELFPLTREELSEDEFEIVIDLFASPGSKHRQDSRGSEHRQDSRVSESYVQTQDRDRARPLKRRVEVSMRNLTREDRDAFTAAKEE